MFISEVEHIVGLSKKSIRYYEENGLLSPKRNKENDYRIYQEEDIHKLKIIKFLRELGVPIKELKQLDKHEITLQECMNDRIKKIEKEQKNYQSIKDMCLEISRGKETFTNIDITKYFQNINKLNKEGFTMREVREAKRKKIGGAIFSSLLFSVFFILIAITIVYFQITEKEKAPCVIFIILMMISLLPVVATSYNLVVRIKEIKKGEEDEASKY